MFAKPVATIEVCRHDSETQRYKGKKPDHEYHVTISIATNQAHPDPRFQDARFLRKKATEAAVLCDLLLTEGELYENVVQSVGIFANQPTDAEMDRLRAPLLGAGFEVMDLPAKTITILNGWIPRVAFVRPPRIRPPR